MSDESWRNRLNLFGPDSLSELDRWRQDSAQREEARAKAQQQSKQEREHRERELAHASATEQVVALRAELTALREEHESLRTTVVGTMNATADAFGTLAGQRMDLSAEQRGEIHDLKVEVAKLSSTLTELHQAKGAFRFARETGDAGVTDVPSFLPRRIVN